MSIYMIFVCFGIGQILDYRFWKNYGQVIYDYSENNHHATNGETIDSESRDCIFTDRGVYLNSDCMIKFPDFPFPNPVSVVIWVISDTLIYSDGANSGKLFCRWNPTKYFLIFHDKTALRVRIVLFDSTWIQRYSLSDTWKTSSQYLDEWVLIIFEINQSLIKIKKNSENILKYSLNLPFIDDLNITERRIHIGTDVNTYPGLGGFVWYVTLFNTVDIEGNFLSASSSNCFVGTCSSCEPSFVFPSLGTGCASNSVNISTDSNGNICTSAYGCKGSSAIKCNCPGLSCEFTSKNLCYCIDSVSNTKYQSSCSCSSLGQGCCHNDCASCSSEFSCLTCKANFTKIINGECICTDGYFKDPTSSSLHCKKCNIACNTCSSDKSCTKCVENLALLIDGQCVCPAGYFESLSNTSFSCLSCLSECSTCSDSTSCLTCKDQNAFLQNGRCLCHNTFFGEFSGDLFQRCVKCEESCFKCSGIGQCLECSSANTVINNGTCVCAEGFGVDCQCPEDHYLDANICMKCLNECKTCQDGKTCLSCKDKKATLVNDQTCKCDQGYYLNKSGSCVSCSDTCLNCSLNKQRNIIECFECVVGYLLDSGNCFKICELSQKDDQCMCPTDFIKIRDICQNRYFELFAVVKENNDIYLNFSEKLKNTLNRSDILIETAVEDFSFIITKKSSRLYVISFDFKSTVLKNTAFQLKLGRNIQSFQNKTLRNHEFSLFFNEFEFIQKFFKEAIKKIESGGQVSNTIAFFFAMFTNPSSGWVLLNTLQMIYFLPLSQKPLTSVANKFCKAIGKSNSLNLPKLFLNPNSSDIPFEQARKIGIVTSNVWINLGQEITIFLIIVVLFPFLYMISRLNFRYVSQKSRDLCKMYRYSFFIRFWLQSHLTFGVYSLINLESRTEHPNNVSAINKAFSFIFTVNVIQIVFIATPAISFITIWVDLPQITSNDSKYMDRNGSLFQEFEYEKGLKYTLFNILLGCRRVVFTISQIYLSDFELLQRSLNLASSFCLFLYLAIFRPFKVKIVMMSNLITELLLLFVFALIFGRSLFGLLKNDYVFDICFTSILIGGLIFQYLVCLITFVLKIKDIVVKYLRKN